MFNEICLWSKPYSQQLKAFSKDRLRSVHNPIAIQFLRKDVDLGEAEAIVLALENGIQDILIDDWKGRKIAQVNGLYPIGTVGVLLQARQLGHISQIKPHLDKLIANRIRIGHNLYQQALKLADESV